MGLDSAWLDIGRDDASGEHVPTYELASLEAFETIVSESDRCAIRPAGDPYVPARGTAYRFPPRVA